MTGLKYVHAVKKMGVRVENETYMVGSYGPKMELYEYMTPFDDMPTGMLARGTIGSTVFTLSSLSPDTNDLISYVPSPFSRQIQGDFPLH